MRPAVSCRIFSARTLRSKKEWRLSWPGPRLRLRMAWRTSVDRESRPPYNWFMRRSAGVSRVVNVLATALFISGGELQAEDGMKKATFAGGCFWGVEKIFREVDGVVDTSVGYTGGHAKNPSYEQV